MRWLWPILLAALVSACGARYDGRKGGFVKARPATPQAAERRFVLAIGVSDYGAGSGWHDLRFPGADARAMANALQQGGAYEVVATLTGRQTRARILAAFDALAAKVQRPGDVALVYISGHGTLGRAPGGAVERFLVPSDGRIDDVRGTAIAVEDLKARFARLASQRKVMILATCHSGSGKSSLPAPLLSQLRTYKSAFFPPPLESVSRASVLIGASGWGEPAREDPALGHDIYTWYLLEAIRSGYDPDQDGATTISEAHDYARRLTWRRSKGRQRPSLQSDILGADPIVLAGTVRRPAMPLLLSFNPALAGIQVVVDGATKGQLPGHVVITPGAHSVELRQPSGRVIGRRDVEVGAGSRVMLDGLVRRIGDETRWTVGAGVGYQAFLDSRSRSQLVEPLALPRLTVSREARGWHAFAEVAGTVGDAESQARLPTQSGRVFAVPYRLAEYSAGVGAWFELGGGRAWRWGLGPIFNGVWFRRQLALPGAPEEESYFSVAPALEVSGQLDVTRRVFLKAGGRASYLAFQVDQVWRHVALGDLWLGTGVRF